MDRPTDPATLAALGGDGVAQALAALDLPLALVDGRGVVRWRSAGYTALEAAAPGFDAGRCRDGDELATRDAAGIRRRWRWHVQPAEGGARLLRAESRDEVHALQERLDLVQEFTDTGLFERDPATQQGRWDRHMFRIWGLPDVGGGVAPDHAETGRLMVEGERPSFGPVDSPGPHERRLRIRRADGQLRHLHAGFRVIFDEQGRPERMLGVNTDDTDVYELAQRADSLSEQLQAVLEMSRIGLWRVDLARERVVFDPRAAEIVGLPYDLAGYTREQARGQLHPDDVQLVDASADRTLASGEPIDMELRYRREGGGWRHVLLRRALQRDPEGRAVGYVGVVMDISERVQERERAAEAARRLESAAEAARVGLWSTRSDSRHQEWNERAFRIFGLDPAEGPLKLRDWLLRCVHEGDRERVLGALLAWWERGDGDQSHEFRIVRPSDGATRWVAIRGRIERVGTEGHRYAEGVALDVTQQHETLRELRATVARMALTTRALGLGTWTSDASHQAVHWDEQMFRLRGVESPGRLVPPEEIPSYLYPEERDAVMTQQVCLIADGAPWHREFRVQWPDGQVRWITSHSVQVYDDAGRPDGRIGVNWDSTDTHLAAQALRERQVAVAESQAKSAAMSRISHELRTPLNAVLGFTQLLRVAEHDGDAERRSRWLAHVEDAGRHLLALIDDVLELSRAQIGRLKLDAQPLHCRDVLEAALPMVDAAARASGVTLHVDEAEGCVLADPVRLRQVVINLLSNAIKYNRRGGTVRIACVERGAQVAIEVTDTGIGIAPARMREAFEPFIRLGGEGSGVEGSGIGLSIVKVLVEAMGGEVEARSRPDVGSTFVVRLPRAGSGGAGVATTAVEGRGPGAAGSDATDPVAVKQALVIYVEDNPVNALLVREMLAHRPGVALQIAEDGRSGVAMAHACTPDLMLVDMQLPDIDGYAVLAALRADARTAQVPCVALSANATREDVDEALAAGFADYWTKPVDFARFLAGIDAMLERGR